MRPETADGVVVTHAWTQAAPEASLGRWHSTKNSAPLGKPAGKATSMTVFGPLGFPAGMATAASGLPFTTTLALDHTSEARSECRLADVR